MNKFCRILIDLNCNYQCPYCCNKLPGMIDRFIDIKAGEFSDMISKYEAVCLSGGEPLMPRNISFTTVLACECKRQNKKLYIYSNLHFLPSRYLLSVADGWSVGFHPTQTTVDDFLIRIHRMVALGAKGVKVMVEKDKLHLLNELLGFVEVKTWEMDKCDKTNIEDWYKIQE